MKISDHSWGSPHFHRDDRRCTLIALLGAIMLTGAVSQGGVWYVDNDPLSGSEDGTSWANAWTSLSDVAWVQIQPGDTLYISGGASGTGKVYRETLEVGTAGLADAPITVTIDVDNSNHNGTVVIDGETTRPHGMVLQDYVDVFGGVAGACRIQVRHSTSRGIYASDADGNRISYVDVSDHAGNGIELARADNGCEVSYCHIASIGQYGYRAFNSSTTYTFNQASVHHNTFSNTVRDAVLCGGGHDIYNNGFRDIGEDAIDFVGDHVRLWNNRISNCNSAGIICHIGSITNVRNVFVYNNLLYATLDFIQDPQKHMAGIVLSSFKHPAFSDLIVAHNTIVDINRAAITVVSPSVTNALILNNIMHNCMDLEAAVCEIDIGGDLTLDYNVINKGVSGSSILRWNGIDYVYGATYSETFAQEHGQTAEPRFVSYVPFSTSNDFHPLRTAASLRDHGRDLSGTVSTYELAGLAMDIENNARPQVAGWDIGAYEWTDGDGDGLSGWEETEILGTDPYKADTDGDQQTDGDEVTAGTNPNSASDSFRVERLSQIDGGFVIEWNSRSNRLYRIYRATNSITPRPTWVSLHGPESGSGIPMSFTDTLFRATSIYRLGVDTRD